MSTTVNVASRCQSLTVKEIVNGATVNDVNGAKFSRLLDNGQTNKKHPDTQTSQVYIEVYRV